MNSRMLPFESAAAALRRHIPPTGAPDRVDVRDLAGLIWRRRKVVLGAMFAGLALALVGGNAASVHAKDFKIGDIEIGQPWARATVAAASNGVVFMTLKNDDMHDVTAYLETLK